MSAPAPHISVIVPVYNVAGHVAASIASLRAQVFTDFEAVIVDDGSTDGSGGIAAEAIAGDPRFRLIRQDNRGLSGARNTGLDGARGDVIAFLDSDDRYAPDFLARMHGALMQSGADWVACAVRSCFADSHSQVHSAIHGAAALQTHPVLRRYRLEAWSDVIRHFPSAWNKLYRRRLIEGLRFDEGTWFEDHGFFLRAAARTDHLIHLPEPLYLQTRDRPGQITASDDERVFEQLDVLRDMRARMHAGDKPGAEEGFSRIACRLLFERSTALHEPERRARFARSAARFLADEGLCYDPGWDDDISQLWGAEMEGKLALSVVLPWDGHEPSALAATLQSMTAPPGMGREVLLMVPKTAEAEARTLAASCPGTQVICTDGGGLGGQLSRGASMARGLYVIFLRPGDLLHPAAIMAGCEMLFRHDAQIGVGQFQRGIGDGARHNGFDDMRPLPAGTPPAGPLHLSPQAVLGLAPELSARIFERDFLAALPVGFTRGARPDWALGLVAPLLVERMVYIPWEGLSVEEAPGGARARVLPTGALELARGHDALVRAMPAAAAARLPEGWQRRLYARALRDQVDRGKAPRHLLAGAALAAAARRLTGAALPPAGFDPAFGPRLARLLNPASLIGGAQLIPHGAALASVGRLGDTRAAPPVTGPSAPMFNFPLKTRGFFRFRANFHDHAYANLTFWAAEGVRIPFHLSLRFAEALAVANDSRSDGAWRAERHAPCTVPREGIEVTIDVTKGRVRVEIDGTQVFDLGRWTPLNRGGLRDLEAISHLAIEGGIHPLDIMPEAPGQALSLDPRLQLRMARPAEEQTLRVAHSEAVLAPTLAPGPEGQPALVADLTGRHWQGLAPEADLIIEDAHGAPLLRLSRQDMATRIATLMAHPPGPADTALVLLCLDHLRHGELHALLPPEALAALQDLAAAYALGDYISAEADKAPPALPPVVDSEGAQIDAALARFHLSQQADPAPDPLSMVAELTLPMAARKGLFLGLADVFCREDRDFQGLFALAEETGVLAALLDGDPPGDAWSQSALLPYLVCAGHYDQARALACELVSPRPGWILTPPLAWVVRHALGAPDLPETVRMSLLRAGMDCIAARAPDYWSRIHCRELTAAAVTLLTRHRRDDGFARDVERFCLKTYGLSRLFWNMLDARLPEGQHLPPMVSAARADFACLSEGAPEDIDRALTMFEQLECPEAPRLRRELLGPAGTPGSPKVARLAHHPGDAAEHALRHLACPGAEPSDQRLQELASSALPGLYPEVPQAPCFTLQTQCVRTVCALLTDPDDTTGLEALLADLAWLACPGSHFLGLGLAVTLLPALAEEDNRQVAQWITVRWRALDPEERAGAALAPALRGPLDRLAASEGKYGLPDDLVGDRPALPTDRTGLPEGSPLHDTLVVVFSCKPYLNTRIPALREGWLSLLKALDIPHVVVVGDGDGRREGDTLHLDAPDDYEGLPQKTLAAIKWVHDNTRFAHMLKIDDDCFLNAPLFFDSLSYRKFDYYGRKLIREVGQMDRAWHQGKSASARGRGELDRSPEPSFYADGGSGYALSRRAMEAALAAAVRPAGQRLIQLSFMEDKMLGDLLALEGIRVADEDYRVSIRRRSHSGAVPVAAWLNSFHPSRSAPLQLIHLDDHQDQQKALELLQTPALYPSKIWPTYQGVQLGYQSNALELLSAPETVERARAAEVAVVAAMRNEMFMLPHFLSHYRKLGVESFLIADNVSDDGSREYLLEQPDVALFSVDTDYKLSHYGVAWQQALMAHFRLGKWSLVADADELLVWQRDQRQTLPELLATPEFETAEAARIFMLDMYPKGPLEEATFESGDPFAEAGFCDAEPFLADTPARGPFTDAPAWTSALRHRLIPGSRGTLFVAQKLALLRYHPFMRLSDGLHFVGDVRLAGRELIFGHFKYNAAFREKARSEVSRRQHFNDAEEYRKYLALSSEGRSVIFDADLSMPWSDCAFVRDRLE